MKKKLIKCLVGMLSFLGISVVGLSVLAANPPKFDSDFASHLTDEKASIYVIKGEGIDKQNSLIENIQLLVVPTTGNTGLFWNMLKNLAIGLIFIYLVYVGIHLLTSGNKAEELKNALRSLLYISVGSLFIYGAGWIFGDVLNFWPAGGGTQGVEGVIDSVALGNTSIFFQILSFLKGAAFFFAIAMIVVTGFRVVAAADADKSKKLIKGLLNVIGALVIMKVVDFVYYIVQAENFANQATDFIENVARFCGYLYGAIAVLMVFYAGYSFLTDAGGGNGMKRAKTILINLVVSGLVFFGFLLILYQVFSEFSN